MIEKTCDTCIHNTGGPITPESVCEDCINAARCGAKYLHYFDGKPSGFSEPNLFSD